MALELAAGWVAVEVLEEAEEEGLVVPVVEWASVAGRAAAPEVELAVALEAVAALEEAREVDSVSELERAEAWVVASEPEVALVVAPDLGEEEVWVVVAGSEVEAARAEDSVVVREVATEEAPVVASVLEVALARVAAAREVDTEQAPVSAEAWVAVTEQAPAVASARASAWEADMEQALVGAREAGMEQVPVVVSVQEAARVSAEAGTDQVAAVDLAPELVAAEITTAGAALALADRRQGRFIST
ncbi:unnamed protein product, partial [Urochloa humidicola]